MNIYNDADVLDEKRREFLDLSSAKGAAIEARAMMAEHVAADRPVNLAHRMEIADVDGKTLAVTPFREIITVTDSKFD